MTSPATAFVDDTAVTARKLEVTGANFDNGMNVGGSNAPGVGVNMLEGAIVGTPEQFTLLMQSGDTRVPQISQAIGGFPFVDRVADAVPYPGSGGTEGTLPDGALRYGPQTTQADKDSDPDLDGAMTFTSNCTLNDIAVGWVAAV